jgi:hypothetical protein
MARPVRNKGGLLVASTTFYTSRDKTRNSYIGRYSEVGLCFPPLQHASCLLNASRAVEITIQ